MSPGPYRPTLCREVTTPRVPLPSCTHCRKHRSPPLQEPTSSRLRRLQEGRTGPTSSSLSGSSPLQQRKMESQWLRAEALAADYLGSKPGSTIHCLCTSSKQSKPPCLSLLTCTQRITVVPRRHRVVIWLGGVMASIQQRLLHAQIKHQVVPTTSRSQNGC